MYAGAILKFLILFRRREVFVVVLPVCAMLFLVRQSKSIRLGHCRTRSLGHLLGQKNARRRALFYLPNYLPHVCMIPEYKQPPYLIPPRTRPRRNILNDKTKSKRLGSFTASIVNPTIYLSLCDDCERHGTASKKREDSARRQPFPL